MTTALITGVTGMVGSHLADYLFEHSDWDIVGLLRWRSPLDNISHLLPEVNTAGRISLLYGDLRDTVSIRKAIEKARPDYVFHLAAQSFPQTSFDAPLDTLDTNIQGTVRVLDAIKEYVPDAIVHVCASSEVFGRVPKDKLPIVEDCTFHPASPYAISKVGTDLVGRFYAEAYGMTVMTTRMFTHTGPRRGDVFAESSFAKQIALAEVGYIPPVIRVGNLKSLRTVADVRDAVRAYWALLEHCTPGDVYNIGGNRTLTIGEMLEILKSFATVPIEHAVDPELLRPADVTLQIPENTKFRDQSGWRPEYSLEQTLEDLLNYHRDRIKQGSQ